MPVPYCPYCPAFLRSASRLITDGPGFADRLGLVVSHILKQTKSVRVWYAEMEYAPRVVWAHFECKCVKEKTGRVRRWSDVPYEIHGAMAVGAKARKETWGGDKADTDDIFLLFGGGTGTKQMVKNAVIKARELLQHIESWYYDSKRYSKRTAVNSRRNAKWPEFKHRKVEYPPEP